MYSCSLRDHPHVRPTSRATFSSIIRWIFLPLSAAAALFMAAACPEAIAASPPARENTSESGSAKIWVGDSLRILFLEQVGGATGAEPDALNVVERTELTGEYTVQLDGSVMIPIMGPQKLAGASYPAAQRQLQAAYQSLFGQKARISMTIVSREPVYVLGSVAKPGSYDFSGGMTVLHVIAQAGGINLGNRSDAYDLVRESQKLDLSLKREKKLLARLDVLKAERAGEKAKASDKLVQQAGNDAEELVAEVELVRKLARTERDLRIASLDTSISLADRELAAQRERIAHIRSNSDNKSERVSMLKDLASRGAGNSYQYLQAKSELSDVQERLTEVNALITQVEDRRSQSSNEKSKIITEARIELEREIAAAEDQLVEERANSAASMRILNLFDGPVVSSSERQAAKYSVLRRTVEGIHEIVANELTELEPGDLLKVQLLGGVDSTLSGPLVR
jgi:polysaccharide biosynthesis/export protein ExoF